MQNSSKKIKSIIITTLLFMMVGTVIELYLLDHYEDVLQLIPILCIAIAFVLMALLVLRNSKWLRMIFNLVLGLTALSGIYGAFLHLKA
ncbi:MAG: hypothetical protein AAGH46_06990, partial [Bacteroidota bacterium]